eukprot:CAMPEP_0171060456 /NCGR_PEP_ID=MMETSP0766_2-20121228/3852_1 /TAXON_ID=439317 /ORGANISM="Gambierdiscus australes, Strain CAWD 149" /LENGTH=651 /DNA_ID=CAMNT_0011516045 /DNA_START=79 /DNA_END=2034 /DNA_ORIENTATION=-
MQAKRFIPDWLAGTSAGEVMFQADLYLKELSMGEHEQPVLGMLSCHDLADGNVASRDWQGREWFVVRRAEVSLTDDAVLVPEVKMGVEARAQVVGPAGCLEDSKMTEPSHPLVRYAEIFTKNFDLIAERKSVVFHLRELARATVLAKFLVDMNVELDNGWLSFPRELKPCVMQVPQLWNERSYSQIHVKDGEIATTEKGIQSCVHGVYGGVDFGVDRMQLGTMMAVPAVATTPRAEAVLVSRGQVPTAFSMIGGGLPVGRAAMTPTVKAALAPTVRAQGVDLDLGKIDLSSLPRFPGFVVDDVGSDGLLAGVGDAFWSAVADDSTSPLKEEWRKVLRAIFHPALSDRGLEGSRFIPPQTSPMYLDALQRLLGEEERVREGRKKCFLRPSFVKEEVGKMFPASWRSSIAIVGARVSEGRSGKAWQGGALVPQPTCKQETASIQQALKSMPLEFDRSTEDASRFRIYRLRSIEVRTIQENGCEEGIGAVFSIRSSLDMCRPVLQDWSVGFHEHIRKASIYVERMLLSLDTSRLGQSSRRTVTQNSCHYYVVLDTEQSTQLSIERHLDGQVLLESHPEAVADRNSFAKVVFSTTQVARMTAGDVKRQQVAYCSAYPPSFGSRHFAHTICSSVVEPGTGVTSAGCDCAQQLTKHR